MVGCDDRTIRPGESGDQVQSPILTGDLYESLGPEDREPKLECVLSRNGKTQEKYPANAGSDLDDRGEGIQGRKPAKIRRRET